MTQSTSEKVAPSVKQAIFRLDGKTAIVTGGGSGIGRAIGVRFAAQGAKVHILDLSLKEAEDTCRQISAAGGRAEAYACDVTDQEQVFVTFQKMAAEGPISILVNNAGISHIGTLESTSEEDFDRVMCVNVKGFYYCARTVVSHMKSGRRDREHGLNRRIVRAGGSFCVFREQGRNPSHDILGGPRLSGLHIRCNRISPARVHTPFADGFLKNNYPGREQRSLTNCRMRNP
jgi:2-keto-3-deoxy-L-fuconate dehydrogenase